MNNTNFKDTQLTFWPGTERTVFIVKSWTELPDTSKHGHTEYVDYSKIIGFTVNNVDNKLYYLSSSDGYTSFFDVTVNIELESIITSETKRKILIVVNRGVVSEVKPLGVFFNLSDELEPVVLKDKIVIEYVAIQITSRDDKTFYTEYSMHRPNRHENLKERIKKQTGKKPGELGDVVEGFKTDCGEFLDRREAMALYREGKLHNRLDFSFGKVDDKEMQSIYLW